MKDAIGTVFPFEDKNGEIHMLKIVKDTAPFDTCKGCFIGTQIPPPCKHSWFDKKYPQCIGSYRKDNTDVVFKEVSPRTFRLQEHKNNK